MVNNSAGKGDTYRPVNKAKYDANFEKIFGWPGYTYYSKRARKMTTIPKKKRT